jgi:hypothetical protein
MDNNKLFSIQFYFIELLQLSDNWLFAGGGVKIVTILL